MVNPLIVAAGISAGASLLGSTASAGMSAKEAKKNRQFQERMSNTAYTRAATDMENAGLNRILALGSPATTPGGSVAQFPDFGASITAGLTAGSGMANAQTARMGTQSTVETNAQSIAKSKQEMEKIVKEMDVLTEQQKQMFEKTKLWKTLGPIAVQAGKDFQKLADFMTDPSNSTQVVDLLMDKDTGLPLDLKFEALNWLTGGLLKWNQETGELMLQKIQENNPFR